MWYEQDADTSIPPAGNSSRASWLSRLSLLDVLPALDERGRVEDDDIEPLVCPAERLEQVEGIALYRTDALLVAIQGRVTVHALGSGR